MRPDDNFDSKTFHLSYTLHQPGPDLCGVGNNILYFPVILGDTHAHQRVKKKTFFYSEKEYVFQSSKASTLDLIDQFLNKSISRLNAELK